ncbi:MAG: sulfate adenylyltransferase subunit CysN [Bacteroidota bacterium]|jgi:sulfate adenylyltransferase subunit 1
MGAINETDLLRMTTCGSVDDGKSTLIGRLLTDSRAIADDQLEALHRESRRRGAKETDLSLLTDGLKAEREQGITIDVAYRYFSTDKRKFIITDTPGHVQYTRNMVTGASASNLAVVLVDARKGVVEQTCRHAFIASLLRIPHLVLCINKMDLVGYSEATYQSIVEDFRDFSSRLDVKDVQYIPVSALHGDNVVNRSDKMPWYQGATLMFHLENLHISSDLNHIDGRFPIQTVIRPRNASDEDFRGYAGRIASGVFREGEEVMVLPSGLKSRIRSITLADERLPEAFAPMSVCIRLEDELDIGRGDMIVRENNLPVSGKDLELMVCWFSATPMNAHGKYLLRHTTREVRCQISELLYRMDVSTLRKIPDSEGLAMNDIGRIRLRTSHPLLFDPYLRNRFTGGVILIDEVTNETVAAGMIL